MRQLLYISNTSRNFPDDQLELILEQSRRNNPLQNVTGLLLYLDGAFLQVLEGPAENVQKIYEKICTDKRHWNTLVMLDRDAPRAFADWSMGFERLPAHNEQAFQVNTEALKEKISPDAEIDLPKLIEIFYRINSQK
jgi:hypothetical protein